MICSHLTELPSQVLTNRPCCVLSYAPSLYWQRNIISINVNSGDDRCVISAAVIHKIFVIFKSRLKSLRLLWWIWPSTIAWWPKVSRSTMSSKRMLLLSIRMVGLKV